MSTPFIHRSWLAIGLIVAGLLAALVGQAGSTHAADSVIYVVPGGTGTQDGSSWANAKDLQPALTTAPSGSQLWLRTGTYKPTTGADRAATFALKTGVAVYGGFAGTETLLSQRTAANLTILSGDLLGNDNLNNFNNHGENSYHVVTSTNIDATALLDTVTISGGYANGDGVDKLGGGMSNTTGDPTLTNVTFSRNGADKGAGLYNDTGNSILTDVIFSRNSTFFNGLGGGMYTTKSNPALTNVTFSDNEAPNGYGGGLSSQDSTPTLTNVTFSGNRSAYGGGMSSKGNSARLINVTFSGNRASYGGGMNTDECNATLTNVTFSNNVSAWDGGGLLSDGQITMTRATFSGNDAVNDGGGWNSRYTDAVLTSVVFSGNDAGTYGGGIKIDQYSNATLTNVTISGNHAPNGGGIWNDSRGVTIQNSIVWGNQGGEISTSSGSQATVRTSIVQGGYPNGTGILTVDPQFVAAVPASPSTDGDLRLQSSSPAINAGENALLEADSFTDADNNPRIKGLVVDLGAYENQQVCGSITRFYVTSTTQGSGSGESWANGMSNLQSALARTDMCPAITQVWVAKGTYTPGSDRTATFTLKNGLALYGGFAGTETEIGQRKMGDNATRLSGEIGGPGNGDNSYHVVTGGGTNSTARLDGFTISDGNANGSSPYDMGGGMYNNASSPTLANLTISGNAASGIGGGLYNNASNPALTNVTVSGNAASIGGGVYNNANSNPTFVSLTVSGNTATFGGGLFNNASNPQIRNSILWGNTGNQITDTNGSNSTVQTSIVQGGYANGTGILTVDPQFIAAVPGAPSSGGDLRLQSSSPAINAGDTALLDAETINDADGNARIIGASVDLGAYENQEDCGNLTRLYVTSTRQGFGNGESWANSTSNLQSTLARARACPAITQVWVAKGTYTPGSDRTATFTLKNGLALYGGFAGTETLLSQRNVGGNVTRLSGEVGEPGRGDNSYHVVTGGGTNSTARLDGFTIAHGNANGSSPYDMGGGMYNNASSPTVLNVTISGNAATTGGGIYNSASSPVLTNVIISGNTASDDGGGITNDASSPVLTNVTISSNTASDDGGGIANDASSPVLTNVTISGNTARNDGGGISNVASSPRMTNVTISGNTARFGGGIANMEKSNPAIVKGIISGNTASDYGGGVLNYEASNPVLTNVTISGNTATLGGGLFTWSSSPTLNNAVISGNWATNYGGGLFNYQGSNPTLTNATISGNRSSDYGDAAYNHIDSHPVFRNTIIWNHYYYALYSDDSSTSDIQYSIVQRGYEGAGNLDVDPLFVAEVPQNEPSTGGNLRLQAGSPALNAGKNSLVPAGVSTDRDALPRIVAGTVDMGAYERQSHQTITFAPLATRRANEPPFTVSATSSSGLPITFTASGVCTVSGTTVTLTGGGTCTITATQAGDATHDRVQLSRSFTVTKVATTTIISSSRNPSSDGKSIIFTATVTAAGSTPAGTVIFYDGENTLGTSTLTNGKATLETTTLSVGLHAIGAYFQSNSVYVNSNSSPLSQRVRASTTTALVSSLNPSRYGAAVTFSATVSSSHGTPTGTVTFLDGTTTLGTRTLSAGKATLTLANLSVATHTITARYDGATEYAGSGSSKVNQLVQRANTTTVLSSSLNPSKDGQSVTFTARVTAGGGAQTSGTVTFKHGTTTLGTATIVDRSATFTTKTLPVGARTIVAVYGGDTNYKESQGSLSQRVKGVTTTSLTSSLNPSAFRQAVTFTATVGSTSSGTLGIPTGTVTFKNGSTVLATVPMNASGRATFTTVDLPKGTHAIVAVYSGSNPYAPSTSPVLNQQVK